MSNKLTYSLAEKPSHVFCEHIATPPKGYWHIRRFDGAWKLGGGCPPPLCWSGNDPPRQWTGWDLQVRILEFHYRHTCQRCLELFFKDGNDIDI